ncbi:MAG: efflux RND transporter permease subunit [Opitutales bacterium]
MIAWLIKSSLGSRGLVLLGAALLVVMGIQTARDLPVDVLPDLTKPTVTLMTEVPGLAPEEVETLVTLPLENTLMGVSGLTRIRSISDVALSLIYIEFDWGADIYQARQFVQERLQAVEELPGEAVPFMTPVSSLMGEIMLVGLYPKEGSKVEPVDVRTWADWTVKRRLQSIPGVAEVLSMGGGVQQIHVQPDPERMQALGIHLDAISQAVGNVSRNTSGGFMVNSPQEIMVRNLSMTTEISAFRSAVVGQNGDRIVTLDDVADVVWGIEPPRGDAAVNGQPGVIVSVVKAPGFDTLELTRQLEAALEELQKNAPEGVKVQTLFRQASFIETSISNLEHSLRDGAIMVLIVLALFLLNVRTTFITLTAIPLSFSIAFIVFSLMGVGVNSMTLGGLAVAIGMVVDDAIIDVENVFRRLRENAAKERPRPRFEVIARASFDVRNAIFYATVFIILVFIPLLALSGLEGRLFTPIAVATMVSMAASFLVSVTIIPVLCSVLLHPREGTVHRDGFFVRGLKGLFKKTWLKLALDAPWVVLIIAAISVSLGATLFAHMGKDFLPSFREETVLVALTTAPGTSLKETNAVSDVASRLLRAIPEVKTIGRRVGRAEHGDHVVPVSTAEFDIVLELGERPRAVVLEEIRESLRTIPGTFSAIGGPLADRIGHMLSGVSAKVAIKVFGEDLDEIRRVGLAIQEQAKAIPGLETARVEQQASIPQVRIEVDRDRAKAYGLTAGEVNAQLAVLMGGQAVSEVYEGVRTIEVLVRLADEWRERPDRLRRLPIHSPSGQTVFLEDIARLNQAAGPNVIKRENGVRRFVVSINPSRDDISGMVALLQERVAQNVSVPKGVFLSWEGEFLAQKEASQRIYVWSVLVLLIMTALLYGYFKSAQFTLQVLCDIPLALGGGICLTWALLNNINIATLVGMIALAGIAVRNSLMLLTHYLHLMRHEGETFSREMIERGTLERLVPVLMTALSAGIALIPFVIAGHEPGKEILSPVAIMITGGMVSSTSLGLGVTPALFYLLGKGASNTSLERDSIASQ